MNPDPTTRVEWTDMRYGAGKKAELFLIIAEQTGGSWSFWEKSSRDIKWHPVTATSTLVDRLEEERCGGKGIPFL